MPKKEQLFTEKMGRNIYIFPPAMEGNTGLSSFADKKKNQNKKGGIYTGIPLIHIRKQYRNSLNY